MNKWAEDKDDKGNKYGYRNNFMRHSQFSNADKRDQNDGCIFEGNDNPQMDQEKGRWWFKLQAVKNNAAIGAADFLTIDWEAKRIVRGFIQDKKYPAEEKREELLAEFAGREEKPGEEYSVEDLMAELRMQGGETDEKKPRNLEEWLAQQEGQDEGPGEEDDKELDEMLELLRGTGEKKPEKGDKDKK